MAFEKKNKIVNTILRLKKRRKNDLYLGFFYAPLINHGDKFECVDLNI